jgi:sugar phosphate isomerase/epimerase
VLGNSLNDLEDEVVDSIKNYSNIKTMIDTHNAILANTDPMEEFKKYQEYIRTYSCIRSRSKADS